MVSDTPRIALDNTHELEEFRLKLQLLSFSFLICRTEAIIPTLKTMDRQDVEHKKHPVND